MRSMPWKPKEPWSSEKVAEYKRTVFLCYVAAFLMGVAVGGLLVG